VVSIDASLLENVHLALLDQLISPYHMYHPSYREVEFSRHQVEDDAGLITRVCLFDHSTNFVQWSTSTSFNSMEYIDSNCKPKGK